MAQRLENTVQIQRRINLGNDAFGQRKQRLFVHIYCLALHHAGIFERYAQLSFLLLPVFTNYVR